MIELRTTNARGVLCNESQPMCRYSNAVVAQARALGAQGMSAYAIAKTIGGINRSTVWRWLSGRSRNPPARIVAKRVIARRIPAERYSCDHQQHGENPVPESDTQKP